MEPGCFCVTRHQLPGRGVRVLTLATFLHSMKSACPPLPPHTSSSCQQLVLTKTHHQTLQSRAAIQHPDSLFTSRVDPIESASPQPKSHIRDPPVQCSLNPNPKPNHKPYTLNRKPQTPNPKPLNHNCARAGLRCGGGAGSRPGLSRS